MDLPAPVSPVSTFKPAAKFSSAFSMRTTSRTVSEASMGRRSEDGTERPADPGFLVFRRSGVLRGEQRISVAIPTGARIVVAKHGGRGLRFLDNAERKIGLGQPFERF